MRRDTCACGHKLVFPDDMDTWPALMLEHVRTVRHREWAAAAFPDRVTFEPLFGLADAYERRLVAA